MRLWLLLALLIITRGVVPQEAVVVDTVQFEVGQRWSYEVRPEDPGSTVVIGKVENLPKLGTVVHISVLDVNIKSPHAPGGLTHAVHHMPISPSALQTSVTELSGTGSPTSHFAEGHETWRAAEGGVFSIPVREAVSHLESIINGSQ